MRYSIRGRSQGHEGGSVRDLVVPRECRQSNAGNEGSVNR